MPPDPPRVLYPLALGTFAYCVLVIASAVWLAAYGQNFSFVLPVFVALAMILVKIRNISTRVNETGVSQLTWRGRVHLSWNEVTQVTRAPLSLTLTGVGKRVVVSTEEFADSAAVDSYVECHLPLNLRSG